MQMGLNRLTKRLTERYWTCQPISSRMSAILAVCACCWYVSKSTASKSGSDTPLESICSRAIASRCLEPLQVISKVTGEASSNSLCKLFSPKSGSLPDTQPVVWSERLKIHESVYVIEGRRDRDPSSCHVYERTRFETSTDEWIIKLRNNRSTLKDVINHNQTYTELVTEQGSPSQGKYHSTRSRGEWVESIREKFEQAKV
jgi:hypothetical protein